MEVSNEKIQGLLSRIDESLESKELFNNGFNNQIYFIRTRSGKDLVLRLTNPLEKWKIYKTLNEVKAMNFLRENTDMPIPQILDYSLEKDLVGFEYILMNRIEGVPLSQNYDSLSKEQRIDVLRQIANYYVEMKKFEFDKIGWFSQGMEISRIGDILSGPFVEFNDYMREEVGYLLNQAKNRDDLNEYVESSEEVLGIFLSNVKVEPKKVFTSNDMMLKNFMYKDGKIVGVLDFEWAGSYPEYNDLMNVIGDFKFDQYVEEKEEFFRVLEENGLETEVPEPFFSIYSLKDTLTGLVYYKDWFDNGEEADKYYNRKIENLKKILR